MSSWRADATNEYGVLLFKKISGERPMAAYLKVSFYLKAIF